MKYILLVSAALGLLGRGALAGDGPGLFWALSGPEGRSGYLLGTIHSEDPRVLEFSEAFSAALAGSRVFAMELVPDLATLARLARYMHLPEGQDLRAIAGEQRFRGVAAALARYGVPEAQVARMKPWAAMLTLSVPPPETGLFMDYALSLRAEGLGLEVRGLETLDEQLSFLENLAPAQQLELLDHAVRHFDEVDAVHTSMVDAYLHNDLARLEALTEAQMETLNPATRAYFMEQGIDARNRRMLRSALPLLERGPAFIAVGALHLPGAEGLLALLRAAGYEARPLPPPFAGSVAADELRREQGHHAQP